MSDVEDGDQPVPCEHRKRRAHDPYDGLADCLTCPSVVTVTDWRFWPWDREAT